MNILSILTGLLGGYILFSIIKATYYILKAIVLFFIEWYIEYSELSNRNKYRKRIGLPKIKQTNAIKE
jgi:uncharacterized membrane protein YobD (UPF0266 family)